MNFHVGQRVVCIDDNFYREIMRVIDLSLALPTRGCVYTIREITSSFNPPKGLHLRLFEIKNSIVDWQDGHVSEPAFGVRRFRPVKETDISVFTAMLTPTPKQKVNL